MAKHIERIIDALIRGKIKLSWDHIPYFHDQDHLGDIIWPYRF